MDSSVSCEQRDLNDGTTDLGRDRQLLIFRDSPVPHQTLLDTLIPLSGQMVLRSTGGSLTLKTRSIPQRHEEGLFLYFCSLTKDALSKCLHPYEQMHLSAYTLLLVPWKGSKCSPLQQSESQQEAVKCQKDI